MTMDIQTAAKMEYQKRMKERLAGVPMPLEILMQSDAPITQEHLDAINNGKNYENRERIPEPLLPYSDLYHELTGQEPTKRTFTDWIDTFWAWKDEKLELDNIRMAWAQAQQPDKGFTVGRPGALTVTAVGMKSKAKPALPQINEAAVQATQRFIEERERNFVRPTTPGIPEVERERMRQLKARLAAQRMTR